MTRRIIDRDGALRPAGREADHDGYPDEDLRIRGAMEPDLLREHGPDYPDPWPTYLPRHLTSRKTAARKDDDHD